MTTLTPSQIASAGAILLSLLVSYVPVLQAWYSHLDKVQRALAMFGAVVIVALAAFGLSCTGWFSFVECSALSLNNLLAVLFNSLLANQLTYLVTPKTAQAERFAAERLANRFDLLPAKRMGPSKGKVK